MTDTLVRFGAIVVKADWNFVFDLGKVQIQATFWHATLYLNSQNYKEKVWK